MDVEGDELLFGWGLVYFDDCEVCEYMELLSDLNVWVEWLCVCLRWKG